MTHFPHLQVCLLGGFSLTVDGQPQTSINQPQQQSLLAYLMLQTATPQLRRRMAFLFWPDSSEARAHANLRRALYKLRNDCPAIEHYLVSTNTTICWQRSARFSLDVLTYETNLEQAHEALDSARARSLLQLAADSYGGELLPGCYDDWILPERDRLNQGYIHLVYQLATLLAEAGDYESALQYTTHLRHADPLREQTYRLLITLHAGRGDRAAALRVYQDCVAMLERDLGVEPSVETQALYQRILNQTASLSLPKRSPTVLPSTTMSPSTNHKLIGRQVEWQSLQSAWHQAQQGNAQLLLIQGEAGIGKTHLAETLLTRANQHNQQTVHTRAYAAEGQLTYSPVVEWLRSPPYIDLLASLEDIWLIECARLLPELLSTRPHLPAPPPLRDDWQRQRLFEALARAVYLPQEPLLILLDDLQWADKETLEWLHFLLRFDPMAPLLLIGTVRMSEVSVEHPLTILRHELQREDRIQEIPLSPLTVAASDELAQQTAGSTLPAETLANLHHYAEGVPLFLVEAVRAEMDKAEADRWGWSTNASIAAVHTFAAANTLPLPPKVYAAIQSRLNQLSAGARFVANVAAVIGRSFSLELLTLARQGNEESLIADVDELWQRHMVRERGANYDLSHDRIRDVAYAEISSIQRKLLHRRVAEALAKRHAANLDRVSAELAHHYEAAGLLPQAVTYYLQAGTAAQQIYANHHARALSRRGLALVKQLPPSTARDQQELALCLVLVSAVRVLEGWSSTELYQLVNQTLDLSRQFADPTSHFRLNKALFGYHIVRGDLDQADPLAEELLVIANQEKTPLFWVIGYNNLGGAALHRGAFKSAHGLFEKSLAYYTPQQHKEHVVFDGSDYGILSSGWLAHCLWCLGYPDQALSQGLEGEGWSQEFAHPASQAMALSYLGLLYQFRHEIAAVKMCAERCLSLTNQHTIGYYQEWASILYTWALAYPNPTPDKIDAFRTALTDFRAIGGGLRWGYYLSLLAGLYAQAGSAKDGLEIIDQALAAVVRTGEHWWDAELYRLRGNLLHLQAAHTWAHVSEIEAAYQQAMHLAREQAALSLELRAATDLARLWQTQGRTTQAHTLLVGVFQQFSEGFRTPDLQAARTLLTDLTA